ncbi:MAG TPA: DUF4349 domain-containing protein [Candidatus Baltobacterales bacterium]|nr:DUF4349 domain-containing protein [Candidatus Baltobacterales bacterium]
MKKLIVIVAILAAAAACGGAASTGQGGSLALRSAGGTAQSAVGQPVKSNPQPAQPAQGGGTTNPGGTDTVPVLQGPPVIRQAQLAITVSSGSFDSRLATVRSLVESEQGYIAGTDAQSSPVDSQIRTGVINFMVPAANFDATIDLLTKVGKVQSEHITGTDVSAQYVDLNARLANAQAQRDAMLALLARATSISDIINIQTQVGQITGQIEQLEGQIKYLDQNTAFSSIAVTLTESGAPVQQAPSDSWGFATALSEAAHNFVTTINYVVTGLGAAGPFLVLLGLGYLVWRRRRPAPAIKHA